MNDDCIVKDVICIDLQRESIHGRYAVNNFSEEEKNFHLTGNSVLYLVVAFL